VFVLPSYREGTPRTVLEAAAMGRPIITTDGPGGCRQTVRPGETGFLVPVKDSGALARAMEGFITHPELIEKMGAAGRRYMEERFDVRKVNQTIVDAMGLNTGKLSRGAASPSERRGRERGPTDLAPALSSRIQ
jgi:glycosyltransferase involved in cell wall biosynthesis